MVTRRQAVGGLAVLPWLPAAASAAGDPFSEQMKAALDTLNKEGRYQPLWTLARTDQSLGFRGVREQWCAYVGDEATALARAGGKAGPGPDLSGATAEDAVASVVKAAAGRRIVMLNEAHTASRHRLFLAQLLRALRAEGFTHLAAETFPSDPAEAGRLEALLAGAQVTTQHGFYTADPVYAEAVREALDLGYRLVAYEQRSDQSGPSRDPKVRIPEREQAQAENFAAALKRWPDARFVVHVGYGHLDERDDVPNGPWFAARLKRLTGIDPLTVGQSLSGSFGPHAPDGPIAEAVLKQFAPKAPVVVWQDGRCVAAPQWNGDVTVFHPSLPDVDGRPGWLAADARRRRVAVRLPARAGDAPLLAQAIHAADVGPAIPADQFVLTAGARRAVFFLRPGRYRLRLETATGFTPLRDVSV